MATTSVIDELKKSQILELLEQGKRVDGRTLDEPRKLIIEINAIPKANGSARVRLGDTSDPKEVLRRLERQLLDKGAELERLAKAERGGGVLPVGPDLREKWEQMNMADNLIYQFSARLVRDSS